ncbi:ATP-binding protein [Aureimonas sp. ME7]|uniref:ATP-binding protein n=1 Tax=Aureimonas sp. ME7 TaxID=2744252 RepID=UPI0015F6A41D|nr:ATP-binding protein [Aureimonas sp. ME7]
MNSLRTRLILFQVAAIVTVVVLAAGGTFLLVDKPDDGMLLRAQVEQVAATARLVGGSPERAEAAGLKLGSRPAGEAVDEDETREMQEALAAAGTPLPVLVASAGGRMREVAVPLGGGPWVFLRLASAPPPPVRPMLAYVSLVILGAGVVSLAVAARVLRPVRLMDEIIASVRTDGTLSPVAERGPPEERAIARAFNALSARLSAGVESRMRFVAAAGHDLRTPMTRLRLRAEFLPEGERAVWLRDLAEMDAIADSAIRLVREDVDLASFDPVAPADLLAEIASELHDLGMTAELGTLFPAALVEAQPLALKRALRNLAENAVRHGGGASIAMEGDGNTVAITIEDRGPGIPEPLLGRVFEPFFRVDPARRKGDGGTGLGLAIAKDIVERQGGQLTLRNRPGGGLRQEVRLPRLDEGAPRE